MTTTTCHTTAAAVANEFLKLGSQEPNVPPIDQMKLQKLVYYAHAWYLAHKGRPLFEDDIQAWPWGPVVREIYSQTRRFGQNPITSRIQAFRKVGNGSLDFQLYEPDGVEDPETKIFIKQIWDTHKAFSGIQLSNSTHAQGEPWTIVKEKYNSLDSKPIIPNEVIEAVFKRKLENA